MKSSAILFAAVLIAVPGMAAWADEIDEQIQRGQKAYTDKNYREAIRELQFAISEVQEKLNAQYLTLLPEPLPGWQADAAEAQTMPVALMGGGIQVSRHYRKAEGAEEVTIELLGDTPMLQALSVIMTNPPMIASEPGFHPFRHGEYRGIVKHDREDQSVELSLMVANRVLVKLSGQHIGDEKPLDAYLKAIDFKKIEAVMAK
jgi:hypothetical protein